MPIDCLGIIAILAENFIEKESHIPGVTFGILMLFLFLLALVWLGPQGTAASKTERHYDRSGRCSG